MGKKCKCCRGPRGFRGPRGCRGPRGFTGATGATGPVGPAGSAVESYGNVYHLTELLDAVIVGGEDIPFSNNGPLFNITHTADTTDVIVQNTGDYEILYGVSITAGVGASIAIAVNDVVEPSTVIEALVAVGELTGRTILTLTAGDVVTLRNNSLVPITLALDPAVSAQMNLVQLS